jgi:hypothetical protein
MHGPRASDAASSREKIQPQGNDEQRHSYSDEPVPLNDPTNPDHQEERDYGADRAIVVAAGHRPCRLRHLPEGKLQRRGTAGRARAERPWWANVLLGGLTYGRHDRAPGLSPNADRDAPTRPQRNRWATFGLRPGRDPGRLRPQAIVSRAPSREPTCRCFVTAASMGL